MNNDFDVPILSVKNLSKKYYGQKHFAIQNINFTIQAGQIVGLLGSNGAGKSTTLKCITGMLKPTEGDAIICGSSVVDEPIVAKSHFTFVTDNHSVFEKMTGIQYINFLADVYGVSNENREGKLEELDNVFHLGTNIKSLICNYSHGMKQKICMMGSLISNPKLWILDEPMIGLDPSTRTSVMTFMQDYVKQGNSILFSSHNLDVIKKLCHRAIIIDKGIMQADLDLLSILKANPDYYFDEFYDKLATTTVDVENESGTEDTVED